MTQFEQENDLGRGGGEVDDVTMEKAERTAAERRGTGNVEDGPDRVVPVAEDEENPQPTAKFSSGRRAGGDED